MLVAQPLTRQELADLTGTTLYTASRTLAKWESLGCWSRASACCSCRSTEELEESPDADE